jgi:hypothetical protein
LHRLCGLEFHIKIALEMRNLPYIENLITFTQKTMVMCSQNWNSGYFPEYQVSLLNTDYKIFTKALTIKLARVAPDVIHPAQAGFVPGRHIYDQIWLTKRIIELAEATEQNGVIVALDQEKAYDKIEHD